MEDIAGGIWEGKTIRDRSPLLLEWAGLTASRMVGWDGWGGILTGRAEGKVQVTPGHHAPPRPERRAGRAPGKFHWVAEGSLQRRGRRGAGLGA